MHFNDLILKYISDDPVLLFASQSRVFQHINLYSFYPHLIPLLAYDYTILVFQNLNQELMPFLLIAIVYMKFLAFTIGDRILYYDIVLFDCSKVLRRLL